jgi:penicillin-binding protein 2
MPIFLLRKLKNLLGFSGSVRRRYQDINPEDIFMDSTNLPGFEEHALEGRIEKPMSHGTFFFFKILLSVIVVALMGKLWMLAVMDGRVYAEISEKNRLEQTLIFANRGAIIDRKGVELATNSVKDDPTGFAGRLYAPIEGLAHVVGYIKYPKKDKSGVFYDINYSAKEGVELVYDELLRGKNGIKLKETDVMGSVTSESVVEKPQDGATLQLSLDGKLTEELHKAIRSLAVSSRFVGGAGIIMDVRTGEIIALTNYPEYDQNALTNGLDQQSFSSLINNPAKPFLNRAVGGLYTPGSIVKPIIALAALNENLISPNKEIFSSGSISVPNPYDPSKPSVFGDWKAHGYTAMREALAVSSDTYFYSIGGGYADQKGLGISKIDKYLSMFGLADKTGIDLKGELSGTIPTPEWKAERFNGDIWRLGDTYITSIGQYGTQVSPINAVRFTAAVANGGKLLKPSLLMGGDPESVVETLEFDAEDWRVVHEGMREGVEYGTSVGLNVPYVSAGGKTGTAEIGSGKYYVHSWSVGFFPYENPHYAWAVIMEKGPATNIFGATGVMRRVFDWMSVNAPEYFK